MTSAWPTWARVTVRWLLAVLFVAVLVVAMLHLSRWQWHKHEARSSEIGTQQRNLAAPVTPAAALLDGAPVSRSLQWRAVRLTGTYDAAHQLVVTLRTVGGVVGSEVLTPLRTGSGPATVIDRGFHPIPDDAPPGSPGSAPAPPTGSVTVTGYLRVAEPGSKPPSTNGGQVLLTAIDPAAVAAAVPYPVGVGYVSLTASTPQQAGDLRPLSPPTYDSGPYLSYSVQWVIFCLIAVGGLIMLAVDEFRGGSLRARLRPEDPATAAAQEAGPAAEPAPARGTPAADAPSVLAGGARASTVPDDFYDDPDDPDHPDHPDDPVSALPPTPAAARPGI